MRRSKCVFQTARTLLIGTEAEVEQRDAKEGLPAAGAAPSVIQGGRRETCGRSDAPRLRL